MSDLVDQNAEHGASASSPTEAVSRGLTEEEIKDYLAGWDKLSESMRGVWPEGVTALEAVLEQRREL